MWLYHLLLFVAYFVDNNYFTYAVVCMGWFVIASFLTTTYMCGKILWVNEHCEDVSEFEDADLMEEILHTVEEKKNKQGIIGIVVTLAGSVLLYIMGYQITAMVMAGSVSLAVLALKKLEEIV